jgi:2-polyprenyl-3-methyl-5-hydroxy-6-metoxy-1,4-benzoquinol methylase
MGTLIYDKYHIVSTMMPSDVCSLLDVGCRDGILKKHLNPRIDYTGIDLADGPAVTKVCNVEKGIPFADNAFDVVVALDVLEHTDNIWFVADELIRVCRRQVFIVLPNAYHWLSRIRFLLGNEMGKYVLNPDPVEDRHRWLVSYHRARAFCEKKAEANSLTMREIILFGGRRTLPLDILCNAVSRNLGAWAVMYLLEKQGKPK